MTKKEFQEIVDPVPVHLIEKELAQGELLRKTKKGNYEIYVVNIHDSPFVVKEVGRLREITFRKEGGGTGKNCDIDKYDDFFEQLIEWNPKEKKIIGGYRFGLMKKLSSNGTLFSPTQDIFHLSQKFKDEYLPFTMELGRSFIIPEYQKSIFALEGLFDGLGALVLRHPEIKHLFGKVTMYPKFDEEGKEDENRRNAINNIIFFMRKYFPDHDNLGHPIHKIAGLDESLHELEQENNRKRERIAGLEKDMDVLEKAYTFNSFFEDLELLTKAVKTFGEVVPTLVAWYMGLAASTKILGTSISPDFGDVYETGLLLTIGDIYPRIMERYVPNYKKGSSE